MAPIKWLTPNGLHQMACIKWLPSKGPNRMTRIKWLRLNGSHRQWLASKASHQVDIRMAPSNGSHWLAFVYGYTRLCTDTPACVWIHPFVYGYIRLCMDTPVCVWIHPFVYGYTVCVWIHLFVYGCTCLRMDTRIQNQRNTIDAHHHIQTLHVHWHAGLYLRTRKAALIPLCRYRGGGVTDRWAEGRLGTRR